MRFHNITTCDMNNGNGLRVVLWVSHCEHKCKSCHNPQTWSEDSGVEFDEEAEKELFEEISKSYHTGLTLSGGDPLSRKNRDEVLYIAKKVKQLFPTKDIWCYTGYTLEQLESEEILNYIDVLIDGKFIEEKKNSRLKWRGSSNQRIWVKDNGVFVDKTVDFDTNL